MELFLQNSSNVKIPDSDIYEELLKKYSSVFIQKNEQDEFATKLNINYPK